MQKIAGKHTVAIQGLIGSNHYLAANYFFAQPKVVECMSFNKVFEVLDSNQVEYAVVAFENSSIGSINKVYDLLRSSKAQIVAEVFMRIEHSLVGGKKSSLNGVRAIYSQIFAIEQCEKFLHKLGSNQKIDIHERDDTAESAKYVAKLDDSKSAAIAPTGTADIYGLKVLKRGIEDEHHNYTRFIVLSHRKSVNKKANKTSIILKISHEPGSLHKALGCFAERNTNLSKLVSRPIAGNLSEYWFYLDFEAGVHEKQSVEILDELKKFGNSVTILGSYQKGEVLT